MPIRIQESVENQGLDAVAYLVFDDGSDSKSLAVALFVVNEIGEPLHFVYDQAHIPTAWLWRSDDLRRHTIRHLTRSVLSACPIAPRLLLCMCSETYPELFTEHIRLDIPVCRFSENANAQKSPQEIETQTNDGRPLRMFWYPAAPNGDSREARLLESLRTRVGDLEPFHRARPGLAQSLGGASRGKQARPKA